jgi:lysophospholipase L1-like esterase
MTSAFESKGCWTVRAAIALAIAALLVPAAALADRDEELDGHRFATWESALEGVHGTSGDFTVRNIARASVSGTRIRVRIGNQYGTQSITIRAATIGLQRSVAQPALIPESLRTLTFHHGQTSVNIKAGELVWSDPVSLRVHAQQNMALSLHAPGAQVNDHTFPAPETNPPGCFISSTAGDHTADVPGASFPSTYVFQNTRTPGWHPGELLWVDLIDVSADIQGTIVAFGDSITDGYQVSGGGDRWTDLLSERINQLPAERQKSIVNAGISGNTVSRQPNPYDPTQQCCGAPAPVRLERDVLSVPGVTDVMLLEGTNDLGGDGAWPPSPAPQVIGGIQEIVARVRARGLRIVCSTVLPMCNPAGSSKEQNRLQVNAFIRTQGSCDAVIDWDAVMKDPADPTRMRAAWMNDCYHPNALGDRQMADAVDLAIFGLGRDGED